MMLYFGHVSKSFIEFYLYNKYVNFIYINIFHIDFIIKYNYYIILILCNLRECTYIENNILIH